jgi:acyl-CoA dehydrogenase
MALMVSLTVAWTEFRHLFYVPSWFRYAHGFIAVVLLGFCIKPLRRLLISDRLYGWFRKVMPAVSATEQEALDAGSVWWDAEIFSGRPRWRSLLKTPAPSLSKKEQAFLDGPVEELCHLLDDWKICETYRNLPDEVWQFIREHRLFSMIIPEAYGGLGFSAQANSAVVMKLASRNLTAAVTVMVPNSLGPGELLLHFGTDERVPLLATPPVRGDSCFALASPAGSMQPARRIPAWYAGISAARKCSVSD